MKSFGSIFVSALLALSAIAPPASASGRVFTMTNATDGNCVVAYVRNGQGHIAEFARFPTGGNGTGAGLGSQGSLTLSREREWLFAVNAGTNELSVFRVNASGLVLTEILPSGGVRPISVSVHDDLVYVLHAGMPNVLTGFRLNEAGQLTPIRGSRRFLSTAMADPAQVEFSPFGNQLVVTEKATNQIDTFTVDGAGRLHDFTTHASAAPTPFGFAFRTPTQFVVSEAVGGAQDASAVSAYRLSAPTMLETISAAIPTTETAACWIAISVNKRYVYTTNTGSDTISGFRVNLLGELIPLDDGVTALTGDAPTDMAFSASSRFLYVLNASAGSISSFERAGNGTLTPLQPAVGGLPAGAVVGLAAF